MDPILFSFDDSLFENENTKTNETPNLNYSARICARLWYLEDGHDDYVTLKHRADYLYTIAHHNEASQNYRTILGILPLNNTTVRRDVLESLTRCSLATDKLQEAMECYHQLVKISTNNDLELQTVSLYAEILHAEANYTEEVHELQHLIQATPNYSEYWQRLSNCYLCMLPHNTTQLGQSHQDTQHSGQLNQDITQLDCQSHEESMQRCHLKALTCLVKLRQILTHNYQHTHTFAKTSAESRLCEVTGLINNLGYSDDIMETAVKAVRRDANKVDGVGVPSCTDGQITVDCVHKSASICSSKVIDGGHFDDIWFAWINTL